MSQAVLSQWSQVSGRGPGPAKPGSAASIAGAIGKFTASTDPLRLMLFAALVLNVSRFHQAIVGMKSLRPGLLLVAGAAIYAFSNPRSLTRANVLAHWPLRRVVALGLLACCSAVFGLSLGRSASFILSNYSKTIVFCFLIALAIRNARDLLTFVWAYAVSAGILAYFCLLVFGLSGGNSKTMRLTELYTYDANDVCVVMLVGLACVLLLLQIAKGRQRWILFVLLVSIGGTIARAGSRGGFLGLVAFAVACLFLVNSVTVRMRVGMVIVIAGGLAAFAPSGYWEQMLTILDAKEDYNMKSIDGRKALINRGLSYMWQYPVFGVGIDNFSRAECTISGVRTGSGGIRCAAPHNSFIEAGSELGIPGLLVFCSIIIGGVISLLRLRRSLPKSWQRGPPIEKFLYVSTHFFAIGLIGFGASAFFVTFAWIDIMYILLGMICGLYVSINVYKAEVAAAVRVPGTAVVPVAATRGPGWRVRASAQRGALRQLGPARGTA